MNLLLLYPSYWWMQPKVATSELVNLLSSLLQVWLSLLYSMLLLITVHRNDNFVHVLQAILFVRASRRDLPVSWEAIWCLIHDNLHKTMRQTRKSNTTSPQVFWERTTSLSYERARLTGKSLSEHISQRPSCDFLIYLTWSLLRFHIWQQRPLKSELILELIALGCHFSPMISLEGIHRVTPL